MSTSRATSRSRSSQDDPNKVITVLDLERSRSLQIKLRQGVSPDAMRVHPDGSPGDRSRSFRPERFCGHDFAERKEVTRISCRRQRDVQSDPGRDTSPSHGIRRLARRQNPVGHSFRERMRVRLLLGDCKQLGEQWRAG